jgi:hypothetical protein
MLKDPFGVKEPESKPGTEKQLQLPKIEFIAGQTPGMLKDPFHRHTAKGTHQQKRYTPAKEAAKRKPPFPKRVAYVTPPPYWYRISKHMFDKLQQEKNLDETQLDWIKRLAELIPTILVKVPEFTGISTEDVEVAILLENVENIQNIIATEAAHFDPIRQWNRNFAQLSKKHRAQFWTALAQKVLDKLSATD